MRWGRPLAAGFLSGKGQRFQDSHPFGKHMQALFGDPALQVAMKTLEDLLGPMDMSGREASLRWLCYHSALGDEDAIIIGASKLEQIQQNVESVKDGPLPEILVEAMNGIWTVLEESRGQIL